MGQTPLCRLLFDLEKEKDPAFFKANLLEITQLYFDGLIENEHEDKEKTWIIQERALNALLRALRITVSGFYCNEENIPLSSLREETLSYASDIIKYGSDKYPKDRHLRKYPPSRIIAWGNDLVSRLAVGDIKILIPIASGGFQPVALIAEYLHVDKIFPVRYSRLYHQDKRVLIPKNAPKDYLQKEIVGNNILIAEDVVSSGKTVEGVLSFMSKFNANEIYFSAVDGASLGCLQAVGSSDYLYKAKLKRSTPEY